LALVCFDDDGCARDGREDRADEDALEDLGKDLDDETRDVDGVIFFLAGSADAMEVESREEEGMASSDATVPVSSSDAMTSSLRLPAALELNMEVVSC